MAVPFPTDVPTLPRARLARELRAYRLRSGFSEINDAAAALGWNPLKVGRQERGATKPSPGDINELAAAYQLSGSERVNLLNRVSTVDTAGWWRNYRSERMSVYISYEDAATKIRAYHRGVVPALLQTEAYIRGMLAHPLTETDPVTADQIVQVRVMRRLVLSRPDSPPAFHAVIEEAALRRPAHQDRQLMADQMAALRDLAERQNITIQVVPIAAGLVDVDEAWMLLDFADDPPVVVTDGLQHSLISPDEAAVGLYTLAWDRVVAAALTPEDSLDVLDQYQKEWTR